MDRSDGKPDASPASTATELVPWAATAEARRASPGAPKKKRVFGILAPVALGLAGLVLGAGAVHFVRAHGWPAGISSGTEPEAAHDPRPTAAERLEQRMTEAFTALKSDIAALQLAVTRNRDDKRLDELATKLEAAKAEMTSSIARLTAKIDPLRQETSAELHALAERLDRLEPRGETVTAAKPPEAAAETRPVAGPPEPARKPQVIKGWVLRGVYDGLALVEGADGPIEVAPGETLPGAGRVKSIERSGRGWVVVTSRGVIDGTRGRF